MEVSDQPHTMAAFLLAKDKLVPVDRGLGDSRDSLDVLENRKIFRF